MGIWGAEGEEGKDSADQEWKLKKTPVALKLKVSAEREVQIHLSYWTLLLKFKLIEQ